MNRLKPSIYVKDINSINYNKLKNNNIKCLLFDLDNTIATLEENKPNKKVINLFNKLKKDGFDIYIFSNALAKRVEPFRKKLKVNSISFATKPSKRNFNKVIKKYNKDEIAIIGDQLFTDILGGNRVGITTILVDPISNKDLFITRLFRIIEKKIKKGMKYE